MPKKDDMTELQCQAMFIAGAVRNEMEDFHVAYLTDDQMAELNPIIRNAIFTALSAFEKGGAGDKGAAAFCAFTIKCIPPYWEVPELVADFAAMAAVKTPRSNTSRH